MRTKPTPLSRHSLRCAVLCSTYCMIRRSIHFVRRNFNRKFCKRMPITTCTSMEWRKCKLKRRKKLRKLWLRATNVAAWLTRLSMRNRVVVIRCSTSALFRPLSTLKVHIWKLIIGSLPSANYLSSIWLEASEIVVPRLVESASGRLEASTTRS